mgnify:CR=1 FL=1
MSINPEVEQSVPVSHDWTRSGVDIPAGLGIVVFSTSRELLHINRQAVRSLQLGGRFGQGRRRASREQASLPGAVTDLFDDLLLIVRARIEAEDWRQIEIAGLIPGSGPPA